MISILLSTLRLRPFLVGGHRHLALENLALRHQIAVYRRTLDFLKAARDFGAVLALPKPVLYEELLTAARTALGEREGDAPSSASRVHDP